jgi:hypothetical protein
LKCSNNAINQKIKKESKIQNSTKNVKDNSLIDGCKKIDENFSNDHKKIVDIVQEWLNTFNFLSREFLVSFYFI